VGEDGWSFASTLRDFLPCGVILVDQQGKIGTVTDEAREMLGMGQPPQSTPGLDVLPASLRGLVREVLSSGRTVAARQIDLQIEGRGMVTIRVEVMPLQPATPQSGAAVVLNDLTSARRLEQSLWHLDRLANVGTLSASMAHEIKNALVAGRTFFDLLLERHQDAELVDVVRREMVRIEAIVSRMLKFVGTSAPEFTNVRLHEVLEHSLRLVQPQLTDKCISLNRSFQAAPDRVNGDDRQLQQAFVNLFLNALEAMGSNGTLTVATETLLPDAATVARKGSAGRARLGVTVQDTGAGVLPQDLERLFEPFFTTKSNGTGLGLPITKRIIQEHQGSISVESALEKGTSFRIILPVMDSPS
jgi:signal transduction histidine kinase